MTNGATNLQEKIQWLLRQQPITQRIQGHCDPETCALPGQNFLSQRTYCRFNDPYCPVFAKIFRRQLEECGIFRRYHTANFGEIFKRGVPEYLQEPFGKVIDYAMDLEKKISEGRGLILKGSVGTLKTTFAVAVLQHMIMLGDTSCHFVPLASLLDELFSRQGDDRVAYEKKLKGVRLLVIDDLGQEHSEGWVQTKFENIVSERYNRCRSTIFTTNLTTSQMKGRYMERVIDRFRDTCKVVNFSGESLRCKP